jgi:hypothetical protein
MSNFIIANATTDKNLKTIYNFQDTNVTVSNISNNNYFKVTLPDSSTSKSSFIFTNNNGSTSYLTNNLYIYRLLHKNISGVTDTTSTIIGELVIELTSTTNSTNAYLCFLLEQYPSGADTLFESNTIDDLLNSSNVGNTLSINVSNILGNVEDCIQYADINNAKNNVFVFTKPIYVNDNTVTSITTATKSTNSNGSSNTTGYDDSTTLFNINAPTTYYDIPLSNIIESGDDEIQIECSPIDGFHTLLGSQDNKIVEGATFMVPSKSNTAELDRISDMHKMTIYGCLFCMGAVLIFILAPLIYKFLVIDKVIRLAASDSDYFSKIEAISDKELTRIRTIDICIGLFFAGLIGYFFYLGTVISASYLAIGFFILFSFLMAFAVIQLKKTDYEFMKTVITLSTTKSKQYEKEQKAAEIQSTNIFMAKDILQFLTEILKFISSKNCFAALVSTEVTFIVIMLILTYGFKQISVDMYHSIVYPVTIAVIPICISLLMAIGVAPFPTEPPK